ncbi:hypothetical protein RhiirC2_797970 [Rhizophagus irregularis]|uniref:Uncharacterized protein n=1 Tax=Rhizophagus irregularis TaxID=588596 RepID=A0A2N1M788_9GLOM|nr:hypothetical protein RhiirC2_797970 [Rhizophagus irregularis]
MITKLTGQLSDKEQNDSTTNKIASIGEDNTIPNQINNNIDMFNEHDNQQYFTKIAVLNICTLTEYKLNNIFDYIRKNGIDIMEDLNLWDVHKETYDMDNTKEIITYFGHFNSRIDYIWISENLFTKISKAKIINIRDIINTDHALLTFDFINEDLIYPILQAKKMNTTNTNLIRHIFDFDNTEEKDLLNFQDDLKKVATSFNLNGSIEEKWSFFKNNLLKIKQQHIRFKEIIFNVNCDKKFQHTQLYKDL